MDPRCQLTAGPGPGRLNHCLGGVHAGHLIPGSSEVYTERSGATADIKHREVRCATAEFLGDGEVKVEVLTPAVLDVIGLRNSGLGILVPDHCGDFTAVEHPAEPSSPQALA